MKLEQNRTWTIQHLIDYYNHLKAKRTAKQDFLKNKNLTKKKGGSGSDDSGGVAFSACEDCDILCKSRKKEKKNNNKHHYSIISATNEDKRWNKHYRTGDEMFVSQSVNDLILNEIKTQNQSNNQTIKNK